MPPRFLFVRKIDKCHCCVKSSIQPNQTKSTTTLRDSPSLLVCSREELVDMRRQDHSVTQHNGGR